MPSTVFLKKMAFLLALAPTALAFGAPGRGDVTESGPIPGHRASAVANDLPRLWEISGKNAQGVEGKFYILPVTHNGLAVEYDNYFYKKIFPVAMKADVFLSEASGLLPHLAPACEVPLAAENREILREAYAAVEQATLAFRGPITEPEGITEEDRILLRQMGLRMAHDFVKDISEYGLILMRRSYLTSTQLYHPEKLPKEDLAYVSRPVVAPYLAQQRKKFDARNRNESIDEKFDLLEAYCHMGNLRAQYLHSQLEWLNPTKFTPPTPKEIEIFSAGFVDSLRKGYLSNRFANLRTLETAYDKQLICERNEKWLTRMQKNLGDGVRFYALGMAHVFQPPPNINRCDGLLARLRKEGFVVELAK